MDIFERIREEQRREEQEARELRHKKYKENLLELVREKPRKFIGDVYLEDREHPGECKKDSSGNIIRPVSYSYGKEIICCPEPIEFVHEFRDYVDDQDKCKEIMRSLVAGTCPNQKVIFKRIKLDHEPSQGIWFNRTDNGVNLRPGFLDGGMGQPYAVTMGDLTVHGVVVGRTGSGKSVFLNNLIFNMLTEYAPWELDLYLADFKKVELSRYMSKYKTPHLKTCAATSEIRYVITMLSHIVDCMQARQDLFTRLGIQKISEFRKKYNVVLPRVVLLVDEFQQMFQEATSRESVIIDDLLMSIIKLGRATGFHLLFASQEMSGALSGKALANFKIRFALPCDSSVSADILGNTAAAVLERGFVLVNTESGREEQNKMYRVPFIPDDEEILENGKVKESYFYQVLREYSEEAASFAYEKNKTFYQEDSQTPIEALEECLKNDAVKSFKELQLNSGRYFDIFTLGNSVVYSDKKYDMETFFLEKGRNKNIFAICPDVDDLAYIQKMLAVNFKNSTNSEIQHFYYDFNPILSAKYQITEDLPQTKIFDVQEALNLINKRYVSRMALMEAAKQKTIEGFINVFYEKNIEGLGDRERYLKAKEIVLEIFKDTEIEDIPDVYEAKLEENPAYQGYVEPLFRYYMHEIQEMEWDEIFSPSVYWISGMEYLETPPRWFFNVMRNGMSANMLFIIFTASEDIRFADIVGRCDYIFTSGNNEKIYTKCGMKFTKKSRNSIVIDFKIKSLNTERAFKKYKIKAVNYEVPALNFDDLL